MTFLFKKRNIPTFKIISLLYYDNARVDLINKRSINKI